MLALALPQVSPRMAGLLAAPIGAILLAAPYMGGVSNSAVALGVLAAISALMVLPHARDNEQADQSDQTTNWLLVAGLAVLAIGATTGPDKFVPISGALLLGWSVTRLQAMPLKHTVPFLVCLAFAVPVPAAIEATVGLYLAEIEAAGFVGAAQALGLPVYQFGSQIVSGETAATINSDCSGTMLIWPALLGGIVAAHTAKGAPLKKATILLLSVPLAMGLNVIRLGILLALNFQAPEEIATAFHDMLGWFLMPLVWVLPLLIWGRLKSADIWLPSLSRSEALAMTSVLALLITGLLIKPSTQVQTAPAALPYYISGWTGEVIDIPNEEARILAADWAERRRYLSPDGDREMLLTFIRHADSKKAKAHTSKLCFEAMGWQSDQLQSLTVRPGVQIHHMLVRSFNHVQAVTEIVLDGSALDKPVSTRLQLVENPTVPVTERHATALEFANAFGLQMGEES